MLVRPLKLNINNGYDPNDPTDREYTSMETVEDRLKEAQRKGVKPPKDKGRDQKDEGRSESSYAEGIATVAKAEKESYERHQKELAEKARKKDLTRPYMKERLRLKKEAEKKSGSSGFDESKHPRDKDGKFK